MNYNRELKFISLILFLELLIACGSSIPLDVVNSESKKGEFINSRIRIAYDVNGKTVKPIGSSAIMQLDKKTLDFLVIEDSLSLYYNASDKTYQLNKFDFNSKEYIKAGHSEIADKISESPTNVILNWVFGNENLNVILWKEDIQMSLSLPAKKKKKTKAD